jgi:hypothetical protein
VDVVGTPGKVFRPEELHAVLSSLPEAEQVPPFEITPDGVYELVLVYADLAQYVIIASQTCDISGLDHPPAPTCVLLPFVTLAEFCRRPWVPFTFQDPQTQQERTLMIRISHYLTEHCPHFAGADKLDDQAFPDFLRRELQHWQPPKQAETTQFRGQLRQILNDIVTNRPLYLYYMAPAPHREVPEGYVDLTRSYTVATAQVEKLKAQRIASLRTPYREQFAEKMARYYARIATPVPMRGEKF